MKYMIEKLKEKDTELVDELCQHAGLNYPLEISCEFFVARNETKLYGLVGLYLGGNRYPELKHIILRKNISRRIGLKLINRMEEYLKKKKHKEYVAYVENTDNPIQVYAQRLGFLPYEQDSEGVWFYKSILANLKER